MLNAICTLVITVTFAAMSLFITSLNSGSNGNCYYIGNDDDAILVDAGISLRETEKRMARLGLPMDKIRGIFVSHEHGDHITGVPGLSKKYRLPVYITSRTLANGRIPVEPELIVDFSAAKPVTIGNISVEAFRKFHDAADPHSFIVQHNNVTVGIFTDIGKPCSELIRHFQRCDAAFLEANYDVKMLDEGRYPYHLKRRITGGQGHLSNKEALDLFTAHRSSGLRHLILSHLSKNNNCPELVANLFNAHAGNTTITVASRYAESAIFHIESSGIPAATMVVRKKTLVNLSHMQMKLF